MAKVISVLSAKGGVGTSVVTANMAIYLAQKGRKVLLMDAAPNGGSLHNYMNIPYYAVTSDITDHFSVLPLVSTDYSNLKFFSNLRPLLGDSSIHDHLIRWQTEIAQSDFDYLFIDLGSSIDRDVIAVTSIVDYNIVFTNPDQASIEKTNLFMKMVFKDRLSFFEDKHRVHGVTQNIRRTRPDLLFTPRNLLLLLAENLPRLSKGVSDIVYGTPMGVIYNNVRTGSDSEIIELYPQVIRNYFGFEISNLGEISYSEFLSGAGAMSTPVVTNERGGEFLEVLSTIDRKLTDLLSRESRR